MSASHKSKSQGMAAGLYVVATPIGNLGDMTLRAIDTLRNCDQILCEDTRVTARLLSHLGIKQPLLSCHDHNEASRIDEVIGAIQDGKKLVLVSDAGTPLISDPGYKLVAAVRAAGLPVFTIPGASSIIAALSICGLPTDRFTFVGFLPAKSTARKAALRELDALSGTIVWLESASRLTDCLSDAVEIFGQREVAVARELTKLFEEVKRGTLHEVMKYYEEHPPKGEVVVVLAPKPEAVFDDKDIDGLLMEALKNSGVKQASNTVAQQTGRSKSDLYQRALELKKK